MSVRMMMLRASPARSKRVREARTTWTRAAMLEWAREAGERRAKADRTRPISGWKLHRRTGVRPKASKLAQALDDWSLDKVALEVCRRAPFWVQLHDSNDELRAELLEAFAHAYDRHVDANLKRGPHG